jgi:hypothetical protein
VKHIQISAGDVVVKAELNLTPTAQAIWDQCPINGVVNTWGDEIYFGIPVKLSEAPDAREEVSIGDLGYWAPGHAFCIFFGATPASHGKEPRAASPVNVFGKVIGDTAPLRKVRSGTRVQITRLDEIK